MQSMLNASAEDILAIPIDVPERLFTGEESSARKEYRDLARKWHPDRNNQEASAEEVLKHINVLFSAAIAKLNSGKWVVPGLMELRQTNGRIYRRRYRAKRSLADGAGEMFIGDKAVTLVISKDFSDLALVGIDTIKSFRFAGQEMATTIKPYLPVVERVMETVDGPAIVLTKTPDQLLLRDVLEHSGGSLPARHVAWILNRLYNLACYLDWAKLTHNDLSIDTLFISPRYHSVSLLNGWMFSRKTGEKLKALPQATMQSAPRSVLDSKVANGSVDLGLIKALGRELLGDRTGMWLTPGPDIPAPLIDALRGGAGKGAVEDYELWEQALSKAFGPRKFVPLTLNAEDLYK